MSNIRHIFTILVCILIAAFVATAAGGGRLEIFSAPVIIVCAFVSFFVHWAVAIPALITSSEKYFDLTGMIATLAVVLTALTALLSADKGMSIRSIIVAGFVSAWTLRLGVFLFLRIVKSGEDKRLREIKDSYAKFLMTWTLSALWVFLTTVNALTIIIANSFLEVDIYLLIGAALWNVGFLIEYAADSQKKAFSLMPENKDRFITTGLWSISRHPNYFGEVVLWLGIAIISLPLLSGWQFLTLVSPVFVYLLITKISGLPFLETKSDKKWGADKDYQEYKKKTPILVPYIGKKQR